MSFSALPQDTQQHLSAACDDAGQAFGLGKGELLKKLLDLFANIKPNIDEAGFDPKILLDLLSKIAPWLSTISPLIGVIVPVVLLIIKQLKDKTPKPNANITTI